MTTDPQRTATENYATPDEAAVRVRQLRAQGIHAWRTHWREPEYGSEVFQLLTIVHFYHYEY